MSFLVELAKIARVQNPHKPIPLPASEAEEIELEIDQLWESASVDELSFDGEP